jgi:hypothetical protein
MGPKGKMRCGGFTKKVNPNVQIAKWVGKCILGGQTASQARKQFVGLNGLTRPLVVP